VCGSIELIEKELFKLRGLTAAVNQYKNRIAPRAAGREIENDRGRRQACTTHFIYKQDLGEAKRRRAESENVPPHGLEASRPVLVRFPPFSLFRACIFMLGARFA